MKKCYVFVCVVLTALSVAGQPGRALNAFSKINFTEKPFTFSGTLKNYAAATDHFTMLNVEYNHLYKEEVVQTASIDKEGHFSLTLPMLRPQSIVLRIQQMEYTLYAVPGTSLQLEIDLNTAREYDGEHYLANDEEGALLSSKFKISSIPHHVLVDRNGVVKDSNAPGVDEKAKLQKKISNLLK